MITYSEFGILQIIGLIIILVGVMFANASGVGGAGIIVPVLLLIFNMELLEASAMSNFVICVSYLLSNYFTIREKHPTKNKPAIDYDIVVLFLPSSLIGTKLGLLIHDTFPHPVLMIILTLTFVLLSYLSLLKGLKLSQKEKVQIKENNDDLQNLLKIEDLNEQDEIKKQEIKRIEDEEANMFPLKKIFIIFALFVCLMLSILIEGTKVMDSIFGISKCSVFYWLSLSMFCVICLVASIIAANDINSRTNKKIELGFIKVKDDESENWDATKLIKYTFYGIGAGILSSIFGIGGGMVLSPVFIQLGMPPLVVTSTSGVFVLFTTASSSIILISEGYWEYSLGIMFGIIGLISVILSINFITDVVRRNGRQSIIIYIMAIVIFISGFTISGVGFYKDYKKYGVIFSKEIWSFKNFCNQ